MHKGLQDWESVFLQHLDMLRCGFHKGLVALVQEKAGFVFTFIELYPSCSPIILIDSDASPGTVKNAESGGGGEMSGTPVRRCSRLWSPWERREVKDDASGERKDSTFRAVCAARRMLSLLLNAGADAFASESSRWRLHQQGTWFQCEVEVFSISVITLRWPLKYPPLTLHGVMGTLSLPRDDEPYRPIEHEHICWRCSCTELRGGQILD